MLLSLSSSYSSVWVEAIWWVHACVSVSVLQLVPVKHRNKMLRTWVCFREASVAAAGPATANVIPGLLGDLAEGIRWQVAGPGAAPGSSPAQCQCQTRLAVHHAACAVCVCVCVCAVLSWSDVSRPRAVHVRVWLCP
jgi:hypothetical protein